MRILTWDLEIEKPVESLPDGWEGARRGDAGISCLAIRDNETGRQHLYDKYRLDHAVDHLNEADLLVGFNSSSFDTGVLEGMTGRTIAAPHYDILERIWSTMPRREKGYKLDEVAQRTIGQGKSGSGRFATTLASLGHWAELFDYCMGDVHITALLYNHIVDNGWVLDPQEEKLWLPSPPSKEHA